MLPPLHKKKEETEDWLMSYADMITLLMAFFVLMLSISHFDPVKYEQVSGTMAENIGKRKTARPMENFKEEIQQLTHGLKLDETMIGIGNDDRGLVLDFDVDSFFAPSSAALLDEMVPTLEKIANMLNSPVFSIFQIEVRGHTDDNIPADSQTFPSNWELSAARATNVVRYFIQNGIEPTRLTATALSDTRPKVSNRDANNNPIPVNQAINRRVSIHIYPR